MRSLALAIVVVGLLGATAAAFAMTEALKLQRSPITGPRFDKRFSPICACPRAQATLRFTLRRGDRIDAVVVDDDGEEVRTLARDRELSRGVVRLRWDGRDDSGERVPDGRYRLRVHLDGERRTIVIPNPVFVDTERPEVEILAVGPATFSPDGDGRRDEARISYRATEGSKPLVLVDGVFAAEGERTRSGETRVAWDGSVQGGEPAAGEYRLSLRVRDRAGNLSAESDSLPVRIRFVELSAASYTVRRGGQLRFLVSTDAEHVSWQIARARADGRGRVLASGSGVEPGPVVTRLPRSLRPGRYVLHVEANGHTDRAVLRVLRARR